MTQAERLAVIETLLRSRDKEDEALSELLREMREDIKAIREDLDKDKADLAALKNKGAGFIIGVGLAASAAGAALGALWDRIIAAVFN